MIVSFVGGPLDGRKVELSNTPPRAVYSSYVYRRLDDPVTGEFLGGYIHKEHDVWPTPTPFPALPSAPPAAGPVAWLIRFTRWMRTTTTRCKS